MSDQTPKRWSRKARSCFDGNFILIRNLSKAFLLKRWRIFHPSFKKKRRERERERERKLALTWNESVARDIPAKRLEHSATMGENRWISSERVSIKDDRYLRSPGAACKRALYAIASGYDDNCKATLISTCLPVEQHPAVYATSETRGPEVAGLHGAAPIRTSAY